MSEPTRTLEYVTVPRGAVDLAKRRTDAILRGLVLQPDALRKIAWNCYLQGLEDGYDVAERAAEGSQRR